MATAVAAPVAAAAPAAGGAVKLSPPDVDALGARVAEHTPEDGGPLEGIARYFASDPDGLLSMPERRGVFSVTSHHAAENAWDIAARSRGLNTFYHRVGFWETNYHLATNSSTGVPPHPTLRHYDNIMNKHTEGAPYHEVLAKGALNTAVAFQYGHNFNEWDSAKNVFRGNEDFAREFHQLFFGILGDVNVGGEAYHHNHEVVSIKNTAKALTGMSAYQPPWSDGAQPDVEIDFEAEIDLHHAPGLTILDTVITGYSAKEKIEALAAVAIEHKESLANLPVIIVTGLADDKMTPEKLSGIREMWRDLPEKNLLAFLRKYAISELFHTSERIRYPNTFDRNLFVHNRMQLGNQENYQGEAGLYPLYNVWIEQQISPFVPIHNVFGHQTSVEAFNDPEVFKHAYNRSAWDVFYYELGYPTVAWVAKEWQHVIPPDEDGQWRVKDVSRFLWHRFIADGLKNFGTLEQAHVYALLGSGVDGDGVRGHDLGLYLDPDDPERTYSIDELRAEPLRSQVYELGEQLVGLDAEDNNERLGENSCIQRAIAFIVATPYAFLQEGR